MKCLFVIPLLVIAAYTEKVEVFCSGCDQPACLPDTKKSRRARGTEGTIPRCNTITNDTDTAPQFTLLPKTTIECSFVRITCSCDHWEADLQGGGVCVSDYEHLKKRRKMSRKMKAKKSKRGITDEWNQFKRNLVEFDVCVMKDDEYRYNYLTFRSTCYKQKCSYPQALARTYGRKQMWNLFGHNNFVFPGLADSAPPVGTPLLDQILDFWSFEIHKRSREDFCKNIGMKADLPEDTFYKYARHNPAPDPSFCVQQEWADGICTACKKPQECDQYDYRCAIPHPKELANATRKEMPSVFMKCFMRLITCRCKTWDPKTKTCQKTSGTESATTPSNFLYDKNRRRRKQTKRTKRAPEFYEQLKREYLTQEVCEITAPDHDQYEKWKTHCIDPTGADGLFCHYPQPRIQRYPEKWVVYYFDGYLLPGVMQAGKNMGNRVILSMPMTEENFCDVIVGESGYYIYDNTEAIIHTEPCRLDPNERRRA